MRVLAVGTPIEFDQLPGGPEDRSVPLSLPLLDVERAIHLLEAAESLHHEIVARADGRAARGMLTAVRTLASRSLFDLSTHGNRSLLYQAKPRPSSQPRPVPATDSLTAAPAGDRVPGDRRPDRAGRAGLTARASPRATGAGGCAGSPSSCPSGPGPPARGPRPKPSPATGTGAGPASGSRAAGRASPRSTRTVRRSGRPRRAGSRPGRSGSARSSATTRDSSPAASPPAASPPGGSIRSGR